MFLYGIMCAMIIYWVFGFRSAIFPFSDERNNRRLNLQSNPDPHVRFSRRQPRLGGDFPAKKRVQSWVFGVSIPKTTVHPSVPRPCAHDTRHATRGRARKAGPGHPERLHRLRDWEPSSGPGRDGGQGRPSPVRSPWGG